MKTYEIDDVVTNDNNESDDLMDIEKEEEHDESDWEYEEEPALTFVGDKPPELEPEVENDQDNGNGVEPDDITIVALNNDKNTDNVFEQPELNFEVNKICEIDPDLVDESTIDELADDECATDSATASGKDSDITVTIDTPVSHNLESSLELSSSSSEGQVPLANFVKRAHASNSRVCARNDSDGQIRFQVGHVWGIQNCATQGGGVSVRGGGLGRGRCYMLNATCM